MEFLLNSKQIAEYVFYNFLYKMAIKLLFFNLSNHEIIFEKSKRLLLKKKAFDYNR